MALDENISKICYKKLQMFFQIYRPRCISAMLIGGVLMLSVPIFSLADETEWPKGGRERQKLEAIFPKAKKFVRRNVGLTPAKIASIEKELGAKLRTEDQKPIFYIPISNKKKPMGLVLFAGAQGPRGVIEGAVGLDMKGKVVKVAVYEHKESDAIAGDEFLKQFIGMGVDDAFKVGEDVEAIGGNEAATNAVALIPKKTLVMSYALFLKQKPKPDEVERSETSDEIFKEFQTTAESAGAELNEKEEKAPEPDTPEEEMPEVEDLKALMALMLDDYFVVVDYFDDKESKTGAVEAAKRLAKYAKSISNFEPPKNADQTEEYTYLQDKFSATLVEFAKALEQQGVSDETRAQWDAIVTSVNQAHLRFSAEEIDLDTY